MWLKTYLIVTGIGAFLALAAPGLVVMGTFLFAIPGLVLAVMPTAFMYGVVVALFRLLLENYLSGVPLNLLSGAATLALFWAIPQPGLASAKAVLASVRQPDVAPDAPLALEGDILITRSFQSDCDSLCAALLKTPGVTSVRLQTQHHGSHTYQIVPDTTPGERATATGHGLLEEPRPAGSRALSRDPLAQRRALEAEWNLMLSGGKALLRSDDAPAPDFTIAIEDGPALADGIRASGHVDWSLSPSDPQHHTLTISDGAERVLLRQSVLWVFAPLAPLLIGPSGGTDNFRFGWAHKRLGDGKASSELPLDQLLLSHTDIARGVDMQAAETRTREELARALDDPRRPASDPAFALANQWMDSFRARDRSFDEDDRRLLVRILDDPRVQSPVGVWEVMKRIDDDAADLRRAAARRFLAASKKKEARDWINALAGRPAGSYAVLLPEERAILSDPAVSMYATGLIRRLGDGGVDAVPDLLRLLREYSVHDAGKYGFSDLTEGVSEVRAGFRRTGPAASFARRDIEALLATPGLDRRYRRDQEEWDTLLVVLGKPVGTLTKPETLGGTEAKYRERVAQRAARPYDPSRDW